MSKEGFKPGEKVLIKGRVSMNQFYKVRGMIRVDLRGGQPVYVSESDVVKDKDNES